MPLVTLTLRRPREPDYTRAVLDEVHRALVEAGVPQADRFQRVITLSAEDFRVDARYPDLGAERDLDFLLIEIVWSVGRSVKVKRRLLETLVGGLKRAVGVDPENVMVVFLETAWENWSFGGGRLLHA
ncbi:MAG TPA: tautomerase family protein [Casimicrobiaceae bacterium]|jgi:phenylpyruvate tautomerase PptA (4-oxalocrotonate tautomerase family)